MSRYLYAPNELVQRSDSLTISKAQLNAICGRLAFVFSKSALHRGGCPLACLRSKALPLASIRVIMTA
jgi:hypothetical protein